MSKDDEKGSEAIKQAIRALRRRHLAEEAAHAPAILLLSKPLMFQGSEWKEKTENLEVELQQCYKAQARLSEQLVLEVAEGRSSKALLCEKETLVADMDKELVQLREECLGLKQTILRKTEALDLLVDENMELKAQHEEVVKRVADVESENKMLIDRWMLQKLKDADRINEANAVYEDMVERVKTGGVESVGPPGRGKAGGVVRRSEEGAEFFVESVTPTGCSGKMRAHEGGCGAVVFEPNSRRLVSGGQDGTVKVWDADSGVLKATLQGCGGSVLDVAVTGDGRSIVAASGSGELYVWDAGSGRAVHTLTGHTEKVCGVDAGGGRAAVSAAYDRTIKVWDLERGFCRSTLLFPSSCNSVCLREEGRTVVSGHADGGVRVWDVGRGTAVGEVAAHALAVTSVSMSRDGSRVLTTGRDDAHHVWDVRTMEVCRSLRGGGRVASNWSRSCFGPDGEHVAAGAADGSVSVWSLRGGGVVCTLRQHTAAVLCCSWSGRGSPLASSDRSGLVCTWA